MVCSEASGVRAAFLHRALVLVLCRPVVTEFSLRYFEENLFILPLHYQVRRNPEKSCLTVKNNSVYIL